MTQVRSSFTDPATPARPSSQDVRSLPAPLWGESRQFQSEADKLIQKFTGRPRFTALLTQEGLWPPRAKRVCRRLFPTASAHFGSLGPVLVILEILQTFPHYCICYGICGQVVFDVTAETR